MKERKKKWANIAVYGISAILLALIIIRLAEYFNKSENPALAERLEQRPLDIVFGSDTAKHTIFMYSSYSCSYCNLFFTDGYPLLKEEFIDTGLVKLIMRLTVKTNNIDLLNSLKTAICIHKHGNFEPLHKLLLSNHKVVYSNEFRLMVDEFIDKDIFVAECILGDESEQYLKQNLEDFEAFGMKGTPTFIIGSKIYSGYKDYSEFKKIVNSQIVSDN